MITNLESTLVLVGEVDARWKPDSTMQELRDLMTSFEKKLDKESEALTTVLAQGLPSMRDLIELEEHWQAMASELEAWRTRLKPQAAELERDMEQLRQLEIRWRQSLKIPDLSGDLRSNISAALGLLRAAQEQTQRVRTELLSILTAMGQQDSVLLSGLEKIRTARKDLLSEFLSNESEPLWAVDPGQLHPKRLGHDLASALGQHKADLLTYVHERSNLLLLQGLLLGLLYLVFAGSRTRIRSWVEREPELAGPAGILQVPLSVSLLVTLLVGRWLHQDPPLGWLAVQACVALIPGLVVLFRVWPAQYRRGLILLASIFVVDILRLLSASHLLLNRAIFTTEISFALLWISWSYLKHRHQPNLPAWHQLLRGLVMVLLGLSWASAMLGFGRLAFLLGDATLRSLYVGALLICLIQVGDGLILFALRCQPLARLPSVRNFGDLYLARLRRWLRILAGLYWLLGFFDRVGVLPSLLPAGASVFEMGLHLGGLHLTLGSLFTLALSLWLPYQLSRFARFALEQDLYPHLNLSRGESYTLSTLVHYSLLAAGLVAGVLAVGVNMTQFTVLISALGVGMGFGLQNIVNNLVSGIILLVERPIQVGHFIEVSGQKGVLEKIGLRSCVVRTSEGAEMIVPNGELLSNHLINWTLSDQRRALQIQVRVSYGSCPQLVQDLLLKVAEEHPAVVATPPPEVEFMEMEERALQFQLQVWADDHTTWSKTRSDLVRAIYSALTEAQIEFPQPSLRLVDQRQPASPQDLE
jgi:small-conductance mechanosensitive channel